MFNDALSIQARRLAETVRELEFRLVDLSQRELNVIGVLDGWEAGGGCCSRERQLIVRIRAALKVGDD